MLSLFLPCSEFPLPLPSLSSRHSDLASFLLTKLSRQSCKRGISPFFRDEGTDAQRDAGTCPRPLDQRMTGLRWDPGLSGSKVTILSFSPGNSGDFILALLPTPRIPPHLHGHALGNGYHESLPGGLAIVVLSGQNPSLL